MIEKLLKLVNELNEKHGNVQFCFMTDGSGALEIIGEHGEVDETITYWSNHAELKEFLEKALDMKSV